jgi:hypothetical protein
MQTQPTSTIVLSTREFQCSWCTKVSRKPTRRQHIYVQVRSWQQINHFWECVACGHQTLTTKWDNIQASTTDLETELLHAQWREDNEEFRLTQSRAIQ